MWPKWNEDFLKESSVTYAVSFNGKARWNLTVDASTPKDEIEKLALENEASAKWLDGKDVKRVIVVPGKIVNIVVG